MSNVSLLEIEACVAQAFGVEIADVRQSYPSLGRRGWRGSADRPRGLVARKAFVWLAGRHTRETLRAIMLHVGMSRFRAKSDCAQSWALEIETDMETDRDLAAAIGRAEDLIDDIHEARAAGTAAADRPGRVTA